MCIKSHLQNHFHSLFSLSILSTQSPPKRYFIAKRTSALPGNPHSRPRVRVSNINKWKMIEYITQNHLNDQINVLICNGHNW